MGIAKKSDGRYVVGKGITDANDYKGSAAWRDMVIQLTESGATEKSEEYLNFLKDYALNANSLGEPIMPPSVDVWISNHGVTTAVEADDVAIDGANYTICGIKWGGSAWDYTNAGQGSGGGGSSLPSYSSSDIGKVLTVGEGSETVQTVIAPEQTITTVDDGDYIEGLINFSIDISKGLPETVTVNFNGTDYTVSSPDYGAPYVENGYDFSVYPFYLYYFNSRGYCVLGTEAAGVYTVSVSALSPKAEPKWEAVIPTYPKDGAFTLEVEDTSTGGATTFNNMDNTVWLAQGVNRYNTIAVKEMRFPCVTRHNDWSYLSTSSGDIDIDEWVEPSGEGNKETGFYIANECTLPAIYDGEGFPIAVDVRNTIIKYGIVSIND